jgi:hypothetical protein
MSFKSQITKFKNNTEKKATLTFRGTALSLFGMVILSTPVGNKNLWKVPRAPAGYVGGRLRGNWQVTLNTPADSFTDDIDADGGATQGSASRGISKAKLGDKIYLINNLPYAQVVENGSSTQAPNGMVKVAVASFNAAVKRNIKK